ncbi:hypothetical protein N0V93_005519 [Gnomoniopsis smithogilvyi]|uniref:DUF7582 domain-containing protein n=1 Tax=Gnomoniopsis smithogilvyi TaxID=1191159 RepID=A0A9W8YTG3_9PEZI|nr:hypothetical protein N0V93_005519 [Gnomoniopsis smithogilvyi]
MDFKNRISTPLEAGISILDVHRLPSYLIPALEYTSKRLAEKGLHITLVVARRDYQLPGCSKVNNTDITSRANPATALPSPPYSPASPDTIACGTSLNAIKTLARSGSQQSPGSSGRADFGRLGRSKTGSLSKKPSLASFFDGSLGSTRLRWTSPANNSSHLPKTPKTPITPASCITTSSTASSVVEGTLGAQGPDIRLIHTTSLAPRAYKLVAATLARASRKFNLSLTLVAHEPSTYGIPSIVLHSSILQNEVLHSSEGMTLLSLDHLYTFKTALSHYTATRSEPTSHFRLEDAVDDLRRYILSSTAGRRRLLKSTLVQAYDWLGPVNDAALAEVTEMYSRAYGADTDTGVQDDLVELTNNGSSTGTSVRASPEDQAADAPFTTACLTPSSSRTPLSSTLSQDASAGDCSPQIDKVTANEPSTSSTRSPMDTSMDGRIDAVEEQAMDIEADDSRERTPVPTKKSSLPPANDSQQAIPQTLSGLAPTPQQILTPKTSTRPSAPSLKLQTSFPTVHKPTPKRKKTPVPSRRQSRTKTLPALPSSILLSIPAPSSPIDKDIRIELVSPEDSDTESLRTDFEDADLTARSPAKTPGGSIWLGIDDILSGDGYLDRRRSSDMFLQTPAVEKLGPMTPNGYEDISPVTRGEWGFLMVGDSFRTRTAGVSCV